MKRILSLAFLLLAITFCRAQLPFKFDSLYQTIHPVAFCELIAKHPELILIDVRSPGEYADTSRYASINQGHLKGAVNIDIELIKKNVGLMNPYKDKLFVLYCSHSQRSRRVSKLLVENGFKNFYNLNGGMSVLNQLGGADFPCKQSLVVSTVPYKNISFHDAADLIRTEKQLVVIDVRPSDQYASRDTALVNNVGHVRGAISIPYQDIIRRSTETIDKYKAQPILVYSASGDGDGARMASDLVRRGFTKVYHLLGGINNFIASQEDRSFLENPSAYRVLDARQSLNLLKSTPTLMVFDTRRSTEYNNALTGTVSYKNLGRIKNAIHVEESSFKTQHLPADKNTVILIYGNEEAFRFAQQLTNAGYKQVNVLDGLYDFVWSGFNIEGCRENRDYMVNHQGLY